MSSSKSLMRVFNLVSASHNSNFCWMASFARPEAASAPPTSTITCEGASRPSASSWTSIGHVAENRSVCRSLRM
eukprot:scaffold129727_cov31-Tisochrysis_lutea.AAC.4